MCPVYTLRQEKEPKEGDPRFTAPAGFPPKTAIKRGCGTRTTSSDSPRLPLRMIAFFLGGAQGKVKQKIKSSVRYAHTKTKKHSRVDTMCPHPISILVLVLVLVSVLVLILILFLDLPSPHPPPSSGGWSGVVGEDCLSTQCEFRSRLTSRATQGTSKRWRIGDRLLLVTFLGEARKVTSCRAAPGEVDVDVAF
jgi:hypothetical protein